MKWFISAIVILFLVGVAFIVLDKPKPPVSSLDKNQIETAINTYRTASGRGALIENDNLQKTVEDAIAQVGRINVNNNSQNVQVELRTNNTLVFIGRKVIYTSDLETVPEVMAYWESDPDSAAALLDLNANIMGIAAGKSADGVQYVYGLIASCHASC